MVSFELKSFGSNVKHTKHIFCNRYTYSTRKSTFCAHIVVLRRETAKTSLSSKPQRKSDKCILVVVIFVQCTHTLRLANPHVWCDFGVEIFGPCILSAYLAPAKVSGQYLFYKDKEKDKEIGS